MLRIAFEVSVNGEHLYTIGAEQWKHISAQLSGHHFDPVEVRARLVEESSELPTEPFDHLQLSGSISVYGEDTEVTLPDGNRYPRSKSGSYPPKKLAPGDTVQIRVIETEATDCPDWDPSDPRFGGQVGFLPKSRP